MIIKILWGLSIAALIFCAIADLLKAKWIKRATLEIEFLRSQIVDQADISIMSEEVAEIIYNKLLKLEEGD